jgi:hypothetical protein
VIHQRFKLPVAVAITDNEKVRNNCIGAKVEEDDILRLFVLDDLNDLSSQF